MSPKEAEEFIKNYKVTAKVAFSNIKFEVWSSVFYCWI